MAIRSTVWFEPESLQRQFEGARFTDGQFLRSQRDEQRGELGVVEGRGEPDRLVVDRAGGYDVCDRCRGADDRLDLPGRICIDDDRVPPGASGLVDAFAHDDHVANARNRKGQWAEHTPAEGSGRRGCSLAEVVLERELRVDGG